MGISRLVAVMMSVVTRAALRVCGLEVFSYFYSLFKRRRVGSANELGLDCECDGGIVEGRTLIGPPSAEREGLGVQSVRKGETKRGWRKRWGNSFFIQRW